MATTPNSLRAASPSQRSSDVAKVSIYFDIAYTKAKDLTNINTEINI